MLMVHQSPLCAAAVRSALLVIVIQSDARTRVAPLLFFTPVQLWLMYSHQQAVLEAFVTAPPPLPWIVKTPSITDQSQRFKSLDLKTGPEPGGGWADRQE